MGNGNVCCGPLIGESEIIINEVQFNIKGEISHRYRNEGMLTENDIKFIFKHLISSKYNKRINEQRKLQARRSKALNKSFGPDYIKLVNETKELEDSIIREVEKDILNNLKVDIRDYNIAKESYDIKVLVKPVIEDIAKVIHSSLAIDPTKIRKLNSSYQKAYEEVNFILNASVDKAKELSIAYDDTYGINYVDVMVADKIYKDFKFLPLEIISLVPH